MNSAPSTKENVKFIYAALRGDPQQRPSLKQWRKQD